MRVFKYRGGDESIFVRDLKSLEKDTFWASTRDALNDPCEGLLSSEDLFRQIDAVDNLLSSGKKGVADAIEDVKQSLNEVLGKKDSAGIYSLSKSATDELLWAHYAMSHNGFCIEYELDTLLHFGKNDYHHFDVKYGDHPPKITIKDLFEINDRVSFIQKMIGMKSKKWIYEKEVRIVTSEAGLQNYDYRAVKAIYFGLRMPHENVQEVMKRLQGREIKYFRVILKENTYKFTFNPIKDEYPTDKKYLYSVSPLANLAVDPSVLHEKWTDYAPYLQKMAEIVRREPYCNQLDMVEVSFEKSKSGKPVFFGQYERAKFRFENLYLTPKEIDERYAQIKDLGHERK